MQYERGSGKFIMKRVKKRGNHAQRAYRGIWRYMYCVRTGREGRISYTHASRLARLDCPCLRATRGALACMDQQPGEWIQWYLIVESSRCMQRWHWSPFSMASRASDELC